MHSMVIYIITLNILPSHMLYLNCIVAMPAHGIRQRYLCMREHVTNFQFADPRRCAECSHVDRRSACILRCWTSTAIDACGLFGNAGKRFPLKQINTVSIMVLASSIHYAASGMHQLHQSPLPVFTVAIRLAYLEGNWQDNARALPDHCYFPLSFPRRDRLCRQL